MSGGGQKANPVQIAAESAFVAPSGDKLDQAQFPQEVQVPLDSSHAAVEGKSKCLHLRPAQPCFVVGVVSYAAVSTDCFSWDSTLNQLGSFGYPGESGFARHSCLPFRCAAVRSDGKIYQRAADVRPKTKCPPLFLCRFQVGSLQCVTAWR